MKKYAKNLKLYKKKNVILNLLFRINFYSIIQEIKFLICRLNNSI